MHALKRINKKNDGPMPVVIAYSQDMYALGVFLFTLFFGEHPNMHKGNPETKLKGEDYENYKKFTSGNMSEMNDFLLKFGHGDWWRIY
jgi:hypothetical protein